MTRSGRLYGHRMLGRRTGGKECSLWLTPDTSLGGVRQLDGKRSGGLNTQVSLAGLRGPGRRNTSGSRHESSPVESDWRTPCNKDHHPNVSEGTKLRADRSLLLSTQVTQGKAPVVLNPRWVACLMGFPADYLDGVEVPSRR